MEKEIQKAYMLCKVMCPVCNVETARVNMPKHRRTKKHKALVEKYHEGMITDCDKYQELKAMLSARKGF